MQKDCHKFNDNSLESVIWERQSYHKQKPKPKTPVTIIIGIICKDGILIGCDSRTTNQDHTIRDNSKKGRFVELQNKTYAMLAHSGDDDLGTRVADRIETLSRKATLTDWQTLSDI